MKPIKRKLAPREAITLVLAAAVLLGGVYVTTRVKAREDALKAVREEVAQMKEEVAAIRPSTGGADAQNAEDELAAARATLDTLKRSLAELGGRQVDSASSQAIQEAMLELTQLAARYKLRLGSTGTASGGVPGMPSTRGDPMAGRTLRLAVLTGKYADLAAFLTALPDSRHAASVMRFALKTAKPPVGEASPPLEAEVLILL